MKKYLLVIILLAGFSSLSLGREKCPLPDRLQVERPDKASLVYDEYVWCMEAEGYPAFWKPGKKLPTEIRMDIEKKFSLKIVELKGKGEFSSVLTYLSSKVVESSSPRVAHILKNAGFILPSYDEESTKIILRNSVIAVLMRAKVEFLVPVIFYGLEKGKVLKVVPEDVNSLNTAEKIKKIIDKRESYESAFQKMESLLKSLGTTVF